MSCEAYVSVSVSALRGSFHEVFIKVCHALKPAFLENLQHGETGKLGTGLEVRAYSAYVVAEVQDAGDGSEDDRFRTLAKVSVRETTRNEEDTGSRCPLQSRLRGAGSDASLTRGLD